MLSPDEREEAKERRDAEIEFIQSAYSPEEAYIINGDIIRILQLPVEIDDVVKVELRLQMPEAYPIHEDAVLKITGHLHSSPSNPQYIRKAALTAIPQLVEKCQATALEVAECGEAVWSVLNSAEAWGESVWKDILEEYASNTNTTKPTHIESSSNSNNTLTLGRRIIYSHHIIANSKRRALKDLASQYKLGGYSKIGWPGVILIEGDESNCRLFVEEIKRWNWQRLQVRGEEQKNIPEGEDLKSHRQLPLQFEEIGEDGMSLLAGKCRESGLERLYLQCMKINDHRTLDSDEVDVEEESSYATLVHVDHMNDSNRYCKWLKKTCDTQGCTLLIRQCRNNTNNSSNKQPTIYVIIIGERDCVKSVMKQWRTSNVDVDAKNRQCLERMMTVVEEGEIKTQIKQTYDVNEMDCTFDEFEKLLSSINSDWTLAVRSSDKKSINRAWIWVHHITNTDRLKQIVFEARQHRLGGYLKGGFPGVVVVEGQSQSVDGFISWIKGNKSRPGGFGRNWGHHVRGEAFVDKRELPVQFEELEDDMSKFGSLCKEAGVDKEFREFILQHK